LHYVKLELESSYIHLFLIRNLREISTPHNVGNRSLVGVNVADVFREVLLGITGKDYTIIAASKAAMRGATILKASDDKTRQLNKYNLMAVSGEAGDTGV
jgi:hypothetical protein